MPTDIFSTSRKVSKALRLALSTITHCCTTPVLLRTTVEPLYKINVSPGGTIATHQPSLGASPCWNTPLSMQCNVLARTIIHAVGEAGIEYNILILLQ